MASPKTKAGDDHAEAAAEPCGQPAGHRHHEQAAYRHEEEGQAERGRIEGEALLQRRDMAAPDAHAEAVGEEDEGDGAAGAA